MVASSSKVISLFLMLVLFPLASLQAQIPMERVLSRVTIPAQGDLRGLVDTVGFAQRAEQMDVIVRRAEELERQAIRDNQKKYGLTDESRFIYGISPHDDYMLAGRTYVHVHRYIRAKTVILLGNAHWSETFGIRNKLIFGDFKRWRGPYGPVPISALREEILLNLPESDYVINRTVVATEHSLEALVPFVQYYNREVEIVPILVPFTEWKKMDRIASDLARAVAKVLQEHGLRLSQDVAILCSTDGQHYGDYGWSYYDYHPYGCTADGYKKAMALDDRLVNDYLTGQATTEKVQGLFASLIDEHNISKYRVTWCGRFSVTMATDFVVHLVGELEHRRPEGVFLRHSSSIHDQWLPLWKLGMGITGDTNLHHFVTYVAVGFR
ncbi:MAG TPA: AmmeMemoRadiSam system protein B [Bacteroidetes bacterium]|nr:AmmeMemoRadiSam system protein B [Bacteroidota bacterium]